MTKILVLKLSKEWYDALSFSKRSVWQLQLKNRVSGHWKVNFTRVAKVDYVIAMYAGKVLADYTLGNNLTMERSEGRITDLDLQDAKNATGLVGESLDYKTANPSTIKELSELEELVIISEDAPSISVDYSFGGGSASVVKNDVTYEFTITDFDENDYGDVGVEVIGDNHSFVIDDVYNRNSLPDSDVKGAPEYLDGIERDIEDSVKAGLSEI
ncbi:hypothetical protein [Liquorilactobacillus nagelii]|uniref:hypothetical protein n=1 Tax=Liquorilactobacillus nagelii TaxID=82688 RepID=UPI001CCFFDE1|nr:hypothetical protein [Liquorilactobacillus nagelii]ULQ49347.1 hypothetical protein J6864_10400 [Liquorilactobacillus nagelii]